MKRPLLIIHGTKDDTIPIENSREMGHYFNNYKLVEIADVGHGYYGKEAETADIIKNGSNP
jgi:dipeptidyl aminopeptidase/acylaminoacyl peptidase